MTAGMTMAAQRATARPGRWPDVLRALGAFPLSIKIIIVTGAAAAGYLAAAFIPWRRAARAALAPWRSRRAAVAADRCWLEQLEQPEDDSPDWVGYDAWLRGLGHGGLFADAPGSGPDPEPAAGPADDDIDAALAPNFYWRARGQGREGLEP